MDKWIIGLVMRFRVLTLIVLLGITAVFGVGITRMAFYTEFLELFPANHPYVKIHRQFKEYFGGANLATLVLEVREGDVFTPETLQKLVNIQEGVERLPGVYPYMVFSLASPRVLEITEIPGGYKTGRLMKNIPGNSSEMDALKASVFTHEAYGLWVSPDLKALRLQASFIESRLDYNAIYNGFMKIRKAEEDHNHNIYLAGEPVLYGWIYHHFSDSAKIFVVSCAVLLILLFFFMGRQPIWWIPIVSATMSGIWGLGISGFLGYQFDPLIIVIPFLLVARSMSHGVQWLNRFSHELHLTGNVSEAAHVTGVKLFIPCVVGTISDAMGILIVALIHIPILQHLAYLGFLWGLSVIAAVCLFLPAFVSFLPITPESIKEVSHWGFITRMLTGTAKFSITFKGKWVLVTVSVIVFFLGLKSFFMVPVGDSSPGSPILWQDSDYNQGVDAINRRFSGMDQIYVQVHGNPNAPGGLFLPEALRAMESLKKYLIEKGDVVYGFSSADVIQTFNRLVHGNDPKFYIIPNNVEAVLQLITIFYMEAAPEDIDKYMAPGFSDADVMLFLADHKGATLKKVIADMKEWIAMPENRIITLSMDQPPEQVRAVEFIPAGGLGGLLAAANELIESSNTVLVIGILIFTAGCCGIGYRSVFAALLFIISLILANFSSYIYQDFKQIGLNVNTLPVVTLAIGLGEDYGLYIMSQIKELISTGVSWEKAIVDGVRLTGRAVFYQAVIMSASVFFWWFSPLRFQAEMGFLLAILMMVNMIVGILLLPALIHIFKPKFISRDK